MDKPPMEGPEVGECMQQLADGFTSLCDEYKSLAERHNHLQRQLFAATQECESLRLLLPDDTIQEQVKRYNEVVASEVVASELKPTQNFDEWLEQLVKGDSPDALARIKAAVAACFRAEHWLKSAVERAPQRRPSKSAAISQKPRPAIPQTTNFDLEQDFTTPGSPGQLGCPFSSLGDKKGANKLSPAEKKRDLPTPRSSGSQLKALDKRSQRPTAHDPLRAEADGCAASSEATSADGPACPIRFLDQHSPEEIAQYFEQHKHELPRSHELCVKRFQDNAQSIRELDAKYGNLVSMIQGLGQKHQAMLPETPELQEEGEEAKANQKVKKWAKAVNETASREKGVEPSAHASDEAAPGSHLDKQDEDEEDERVPHFDRPLKEIRVGESPSRPWGVPIPLKYLDRAASHESSSSAPAQVPEASKVAGAADAAAKETAPAAVEQAEETPRQANPAAAPAKGKCPFDHAALAKKTQPTPAPAAENPMPRQVIATKQPAAKEAVHHARPAASAPDAKQDHAAEAQHQSTIINRGVAIIPRSAALDGHSLVNHGTLILGFGEASAKRILAEVLDERGAPGVAQDS